ncbi:hypothetical protein DAPPUDRAFT_244306 [Daphnia pulex]|uniref:Uncharacterized protein n=1 Tax=Daphnia pulex TaxID=6669 RepID=E9GKN1_DAPPU|nr:hypothetical protein DAPPUDRAFT_244306 [Daphnia pulex]|eukprot:EFX80033.1 hypothetical protein DAPPUDRAFT_244306 [Daphnia pulex]
MEAAKAKRKEKVTKCGKPTAKKAKTASRYRTGIPVTNQEESDMILFIPKVLDIKFGNIGALAICFQAKKFNLRIYYLAGCRIQLVINEEVEEHFKNLWVISPFFLCPLLGLQDLLAVVKSYHRSSTSIYSPSRSWRMTAEATLSWPSL